MNKVEVETLPQPKYVQSLADLPYGAAFLGRIGACTGLFLRLSNVICLSDTGREWSLTYGDFELERIVQLKKVVVQ